MLLQKIVNQLHDLYPTPGVALIQPAVTTAVPLVGNAAGALIGALNPATTYIRIQPSVITYFTDDNATTPSATKGFSIAAGAILVVSRTQALVMQLFAASSSAVQIQELTNLLAQ